MLALLTDFALSLGFAGQKSIAPEFGGQLWIGQWGEGDWCGVLCWGI